MGYENQCTKYVLDSLLKSATLISLNEVETVSKYLENCSKLNPETLSEIESMLSTFILSEVTIWILVRRLEKIGLNQAKTSRL